MIEDRDDVRLGLAQLLELHGYTVVDAASAEEALRHLADDPRGIALILLDLLLQGGSSGADLRERQLADPELASIPTVVVSACEPNASTRTQLKPDAWLEKPFRFDELLAIVKRYVSPSRHRLLAD